MKLTAVFGFKFCGLGFIFTWVLQFIKLQIRASNTDLLITCLQISTFVILILLGLIIFLKEFISVRKDIIYIRKAEEEIKKSQKPEWEKTENHK